MTDLYNRKATYVERHNAGLETHRDDIGTLVGRVNRYKLDFKGAGTAQSVELSKKLDIYMTLLEDGRISYEQFEMEEKKVGITLEINKNVNKDYSAIQKFKQYDVLDKTAERLRKKLERKREGGGAR